MLSELSLCVLMCVCVCVHVFVACVRVGVMSDSTSHLVCDPPPRDVALMWEEDSTRSKDSTGEEEPLTRMEVNLGKCMRTHTEQI